MSKSNGIATMPESSKNEPAMARMHFSEKGKVQPAGMDKMTLDQECTIMMKGKVKSLSGPGEYDKGKSMEVEMSECKMMMAGDMKDMDDMKGKGKDKTSLSDALTEADKTRKKVK